MSQYLLGLDIGSSSVKASLVNSETGICMAASQSPAEEMPMLAIQPGWAEQDPDMWWQHAVECMKLCVARSNASAKEITAIGISYQMHGLVVVGEHHRPLRPSIIWCDSRAVEIGEQAFHTLGKQYCLSHYLNAPGNFTAAKLKWIQENEPEVFQRIHKIMLPGDYIAMKLTGEINTTTTGLSEGIFWDYQTASLSNTILDYFSISKDLLPPVVSVFSKQGKIRRSVAAELGLSENAVVSYRAGDQPNNAFSLKVLEPGETAATAGTSGVIYSVTDQRVFDNQSRVNTFIHVNDKFNDALVRNGVLLCINGTGILNSWLRKMLRRSDDLYSYDAINTMAAAAPIGSEGLMVIPFGNGAERILENKNINSSFHQLDFNRHTQSHILRAAQEGIVFAMKYGFDILQGMGVETNVIKAGHANLFLSPLFREAFVNTIGAPLELYNTNGATGAALGAGIGSGIYHSFNDAFKNLELIKIEVSQAAKRAQYLEAYQQWKNKLNSLL